MFDVRVLKGFRYMERRGVHLVGSGSEKRYEGEGRESPRVMAISSECFHIAQRIAHPNGIYIMC